jgi:hypothetical protein
MRCEREPVVGRPRAATGALALAQAAVLGLLGAGACKREAPRAPDAGAERDEEIRPVYPLDGLAPLPVAARYCEAVRELPRRRREACCPGAPTYAPTAECARMLSSALRSGALALEPSDVDRCAAAVAAETAGCAWVTSVGTPTTAACLGIIRGARRSGAGCRSSLECAEGLRCHGLGATQAGRCGPPLEARAACNLAIDALATMTGQDDLEQRHPACAGACIGRRCVDAVPAGGACRASPACGTGAHCIAGRCSAGPLPGPGQPCTDACAAGARCTDGRCAPLPARAGPDCPSFPSSRPEPRGGSR